MRYPTTLGQTRRSIKGGPSLGGCGCVRPTPQFDNRFFVVYNQKFVGTEKCLH